MDHVADAINHHFETGAIRAFAGVRGRVKAAVAAQPRSVSLSDALAQTRKFQMSGGTKK